MIVLDTNVISETMKAIPSPHVLAWLDAQSSSELWITSVTAAEMLFGAATLPEGRRRRELFELIEHWIDAVLERKVLVFDLDAAHQYSVLRSERLRIGHPINIADAQIAAIARLHDATLATRNTNDFEGTGIALINPWLDPA